MKNSIITAAIAGTLIFAGTAHADNTTVEIALKSRPDLSTFYNGLVSTGVMHELRENQPYTVFAPTNEAFAQIPQEKYPCFYSASCKAQVAEILRRHIVPGEKHLDDVSSNGGIDSLFSIDNQHIVGGKSSKDTLVIDGKNVLSEHQLLGGDLYIIDGVMATSNELSQFVAPEVIVVHEPGTDLPPHAPAGKVITYSKTDASTPIPY